MALCNYKSQVFRIAEPAPATLGPCDTKYSAPMRDCEPETDSDQSIRLSSLLLLRFSKPVTPLLGDPETNKIMTPTLRETRRPTTSRLNTFIPTPTPRPLFWTLKSVPRQIPCNHTRPIATPVSQTCSASGAVPGPHIRQMGATAKQLPGLYVASHASRRRRVSPGPSKPPKGWTFDGRVGLRGGCRPESLFCSLRNAPQFGGNWVTGPTNPETPNLATRTTLTTTPAALWCTCSGDTCVWQTYNRTAAGTWST